jgi:hypothetical protein
MTASALVTSAHVEPMFAAPPVGVHGAVNPNGVSDPVALSFSVVPLRRSVIRRTRAPRSSPA